MDQVKRVNYFQGMMLVDEDFRDEQTYHRQARHNHNLELHAWGVVRGLEVSVKSGVVDVTEGLAIDANGKEIWWKGGAATTAGKPDDGVYLVIEWNEEPSDEYSQMAGKYLRLTDTCKFSFKKAAEANDVVLAKVSVQDGRIPERPDNSVRRTASSVRANGGDLEIRPVASNGSLRLMTGAPLTARLTIDAKGNVGIGTPPTAARLSIDAPPYEGTLMDFSVGDIYKLRLGYRSFERDTVSYHFDLKNNTGEFNKFLVFHKGNVGIANDLSVTGALSVLNGVQLNNKPITLRADDKGPDDNHGICFYGLGDDKVVGDFAVSGPVVYGYSGGALGIKQGATRKVALRWNDQGNVGIGTNDPKSKLDVQGAANIWSGGRHAVPNNFMAPGSLTVGNINSNFGGGTSGWNANTAGLLLETMDNTEIAVHDSNKRVASLMYYEGGDVNRITIGRQMDPSWKAISTLALNGNVGIGTVDLRARLSVRGGEQLVQVPGEFNSAGAGDRTIYFPPGTSIANVRDAGIQPGDSVVMRNQRREIESIEPFKAKDSGFNSGTDTLYVVRAAAGPIFGVEDYRGRSQLSISNDGKVGIGTDTPTQAKLVVIGGVNNFPVFSGNAISYFSQQDNPGVLNRLSAGEAFKSKYIGQTMSIYASDNIWSGYSFVSSSDERIKNIQGRSDSATDLRTLLGIEITDYRYKDVIGKGNDTYKKVIGQQVEKVFPQAVSKQTGVVPDIYRQASIQDGWTELPTNLKKGERVKLITKKGEEGVHEVLEVATDKFRTDFKPEGDKVFVFGREVNDFLNVDYDAIAMLNVSATQQLKKEKDEEGKALRIEIAELRAANDELMKRLQLLESKMETAPGVVVARTSNGNGRH